MKPKPIKEHLESIEDVEAREKAIANIDLRYADEEVYYLGYALMLGVYKHTEEDKKFWREFEEKNSNANSNSEFYSYQPVQQEVVKKSHQILN